jgi:urea transporter
MKPLINSLHSLLDAYGALFLARQRYIGALVLAGTLFDPVTGLCGLIAGLTAMVTRKLLRLPALPGEADLLNAVYAGLALGAFYGGEPRLFALASFGGALAVPLGTALRQVLAGPLGARGLPLLGAPFLCTAWMLLAVAKAIALPVRWAWPVWPAWLPLDAASALANVGALFYVANPLAGILILTALLLTSRALALLALSGSLLANSLVALLSLTPAPGLALLAAFNGALVAIFIGGVLAVPSLRTLAIAAASVVISSALSAGMLALSTPFGIPPLSAPFVLTVWLVHAALRPETSLWWSRFWLPTPACPEDSMVSDQLARARGLASGSVALLPPFFGRMEVSQPAEGKHTHQGIWRYALDFIRVEGERSFTNDGSELSDFHAFDQPVLSPAWGTVAAFRNDIADNWPGEMNLNENWGNYVLLNIGGNLYVLLAHLRQGSINLAIGQSIAPGVQLAVCGNSGRSAQPHLHIHVQRGWWLGAPTVPFHLVHCLIDGDEFALDAHPNEGQSAEPVLSQPGLALACSTHHGRGWIFQAGTAEWRLAVETGLLGETILLSSRGGKVQAVSGINLMAMHQRRGAADPILDAFILAFGLTPFIPQAKTWRDSADAGLLPLTVWQRLALVIRHPFGANLSSQYERHWDTERKLWKQVAHHSVTSVFGQIEAESIGWISESQGPVAFSLTLAGRSIADAVLVEFGNHGDHGVPAWSASYLQTASP